MNTTTVIGRLGADPEIKYGTDSRAIASFSVADDQGKDKQGANRTNWFRCTAWGKTAENIGKYFHKGNMIVVFGQVLAREFTGKDGVNRTSLDLTVHGWGFAGENKNDDQAQGAPAQQAAAQAAPAVGQPQIQYDKAGNGWSLINNQWVMTHPARPAAPQQFAPPAGPPVGMAAPAQQPAPPFQPGALPASERPF